MKTIEKFVMIFLIMTIVTFGKTNGLLNEELSNDVISWKFKTGGIMHASPAIYDGVLYIGSFDSCFYAIDAATGTEKWRYKTGDKIYSTAVKYEGILCFESGNVLYGLNLQGGLEWKFTLYDGPVVNQHDEWDYYHSSPCIAGNIVYIGSEKGLVYGLDITNGNKVFQCQSPSANYTIETTPLVYDNKIYFGDWDGVFFAYDLSTSKLVWQYDTKKDGTFGGWVNAIVTDPVFYNGAIFFGGRNCNLYSVNPQTGTRNWIFRESNMWMLGGPTITDNVLYMGSSYQHIVYAFNPSNGNLNWRGNIEYRSNGKPLVYGDYVIVGTEHDTDTRLGTLVALDKATGNMKVKLKVGGQIYSSPYLNNGAIYFGCTDGYVYAVNAEYFINTPYPDSYLKGTETIELGTFNKSSSFTTSFFVYNKGGGTDSITLRSYVTEMKAAPTSFKLEPQDSQEVTLTFEFASMTAKAYTGRIQLTSNNGLSPKYFTKTYKFLVENITDINSENDVVKSYSLNQNYPNPFNPSTVINYSIKECSNVTIRVYDILGRQVKSLINEVMSPGSYSVIFDASDLVSGVYYYRLYAGSFVETKKMLLIR